MATKTIVRYRTRPKAKSRSKAGTRIPLAVVAGFVPTLAFAADDPGRYLIVTRERVAIALAADILHERFESGAMLKVDSDESCLQH